jgi:hypothetical protein
MRLKTETLVNANGTTVVFKHIQDNGREMLFEQPRDQRCSSGILLLKQQRPGLYQRSISYL